MPRRRRGNYRRFNRPPPCVLGYEFEGIANIAPGAGNVSTINITYGKIGITLDRPLRPISCTMSFVAASGAAINCQLQIVSPVDETPSFSSRVFAVGNTTRLIRGRVSRGTDYVTPVNTDNIIHLNFFSGQPALGESGSIHVVWSGVINIQFRMFNTPSNIKPVMDEDEDPPVGSFQSLSLSSNLQLS